jgi:endoglucanase
MAITSSVGIGMFCSMLLACGGGGGSIGSSGGNSGGNTGTVIGSGSTGSTGSPGASDGGNVGGYPGGYAGGYTGGNSGGASGNVGGNVGTSSGAGGETGSGSGSGGADNGANGNGNGNGSDASGGIWTPPPPVGLTGPAAPQSFSPAAFAMNDRLARGINLGDMLDASPVEGSWGLTLTDDLFDVVKAAGFNTVRIPVRWSNYAALQAPYTIDEAFFRRVDAVIAGGLRRNLNVVIDMHHYSQLLRGYGYVTPGEPSIVVCRPAYPRCNQSGTSDFAGRDNTDARSGPIKRGFDAEQVVLEARFIAMWTQIAARYKNQPVDNRSGGSLLFELLNEPSYNLEHLRYSTSTAPRAASIEEAGLDSRWNELLARTHAAVRAIEPSRFLIVGSVRYSVPATLKYLVLPESDDRIIVGIHSYDPFNFTFMGVEGSGVPQSGSNTCCNAAQVSEITGWMDLAVQWAGGRRPLWLGEFGSHGPYGPNQPASDTRRLPDYASRAVYNRVVREEAEKRGISWAIWTLAGSFGNWDHRTRTWYQPMLDALVPPAVRAQSTQPDSPVEPRAPAPAN